ncbi:MAG: thermonuclease family protein [Hyphomicrobiaceae bacterium]
MSLLGNVVRVCTAVVLSLVASAAWAQKSVPLPCALEPGPTRAVASVIDGDTVRLDDGIEVRLLGVLAPRPRDAGVAGSLDAWSPARASRRELEGLVKGRSLALAFAGPRHDRYGRVLAHLFVDLDGEQVWVQGRLVERGHVRANASPEATGQCLSALVARERRARSAGLGLWANAAYQIRPADRPSELTRYVNTFQLVRGRVERMRPTRRLAILELASGEKPPAPQGRSQWGAFRIVLPRSATDRLGMSDPEALVGRNVLVRGWIEAHGGPEIKLLAAGQLELED